MDLFKSYCNAVLNDKTLSPAQETVQQIIALRGLLNYEGNHHPLVLSTLFDKFTSIGMLGEAYKTAQLLPAEEKFKKISALQAWLDNKSCSDMAASIEVTTYCNLKCPMCYHGGISGYSKINRMMSLETFKNIWDKISNHVSSVILVGQGETFLHPNIYEILEYIGKKPITIDTNANIPINMDRLLKTNVANLVFSVDGIDQKTYATYRVNGSFDKAIKNIEQVVAAKRRHKANNLHLEFKYVLFQHNEAHLPVAKQMAEKLGVDNFRTEACIAAPSMPVEVIKKFMPRGHHSSLYQRIRYVDFSRQRIVPTEERNYPHCIYILNNFSIQVDGSVSPCCAVADYEFTFGNLLNNTLDEIWTSDPYRKFRQRVIIDRNQEPLCARCSMIAAPNMGKVFKGTPLDYNNSSSLGDNTLCINELTLENDYAQELISNRRLQELQYFIDSGKYNANPVLR